MNAREKIYTVLQKANATLVRSKNHEVWKLPTGKIHVVALTPSDYRSDLNNLSDLRKSLGITPDSKAEPRLPRRAHKEHAGNGKVRQVQPVGHSPLADGLRLAGVTEATLRAKIAELESDLEERLRINAELQAEMVRCWGCRLRRLWQRFREGATAQS